MDALGIDVKSIEEIICRGDDDKFIALLEKVGFGEDESGQCRFVGKIEQLSSFLAIMSSVCARYRASDIILFRLISCIWPMVDLKKLLTLVVETDALISGKYANIPQPLRRALKEKGFSEETRKGMRDLYEYSAKECIAFMYYELESIDDGYARTLIGLIFDESCVKHDLLLAWIPLCFKTEVFSEADKT